MFDNNFFSFDELNKNTENINKKLSENNNSPKLEDLLIEDGLIDELKNKNENLINYFNQNRIKQMLDYIIKEPKEDDYNEGHKFPFICSKLFNVEEIKIMNYFFKTNKELINEKNENKNIIIDYKGLLMDLDLSSSDIWNKNKSHINLLSKILLDTNLRCLDICHILLGPNPDKYKNISKNETYYETIMKLKNHLEKDKVKFKRLHKSKVSIISDINHLQNIEIFKDFDEELNDLIINNIIKDKDCIFPVYLKENSKKLLNMMIENEKYKDILEKENITEPENKKIFLDKILNYITLKRKELELDVVNKELENEKLLII